MRPRNNSIDAWRIWANILNDTEGRFFTIEWVKKDGSLRRMNGRIFEYVNPNSDRGHIIVKDVAISRQHDSSDPGYRKIDPRRIRAFKCGSFQLGVFSEDLDSVPTYS